MNVMRWSFRLISKFFSLFFCCFFVAFASYKKGLIVYLVSFCFGYLDCCFFCLSNLFLFFFMISDIPVICGWQWSKEMTFNLKRRIELRFLKVFHVWFECALLYLMLLDLIDWRLCWGWSSEDFKLMVLFWLKKLFARN